MYRRDFLKLAGLGLLGLLNPRIGEEMDDEMQIGDLLAKMARGERLNQSEILSLRNWGNNSQVTDSFVSGLGNGQSKVDNLYAGRVDTDIPAGNPYMVYFYDTTNMVNISNASWTGIDFTNQYFTIKADTKPCVKVVGSKIYPTHPNSFLTWSGRIGWNTNATGTRNISISYYDSADSLVVRRSIDSELSIGSTGGTTNKFACPRPTKVGASSYMKLEVYQDSTATLGVYAIDLIISQAF